MSRSTTCHLFSFTNIELNLVQGCFFLKIALLNLGFCSNREIPFKEFETCLLVEDQFLFYLRQDDIIYKQGCNSSSMCTKEIDISSYSTNLLNSVD